MSASSIEKENLEAHVELCAERYRVLNIKLDSLENKVTMIESNLSDIKNSISDANDKHNKQLITIGTSLIVVLIGAIITLLVALGK
jgi:predicted  nucleic acid-binding Zn-ribbon protein